MLILEKKFNSILNQRFLFEDNPKIAVAVSGGPDSIALFFLLQKWILKKKGKLIALIVDHRIRKGSFEESISVKKYLDNENVQYFLYQIIWLLCHGLLSKLFYFAVKIYLMCLFEKFVSLVTNFESNLILLI